MRCDGRLITVGAAMPLAGVLAYCTARGLSGMEFVAGIPGTIGGALAMNAGIVLKKRERSIGDLVESVLVMDYNSRVVLLEKPAVRFGYRSSSLGRYIILGATLRLRRDTGRAVRARIARYLRLRGADWQWKYPNAGCVFKNPASASAGRLIDGCGLKGFRSGSAMISQDHANFILNTGGARSRDVLRLMNRARACVRKKYGVTLEPEIKIWK
jgi:UDP-N-acetylmuramate dehydrogenase